MNNPKKKLNVLIIDGGGRGSVLVEKYSQSKFVKNIFALPGNDLMSINTKKPVKTYPEFKSTDVQDIIQICLQEKIDLVDVAQDNAIAVALVDELIKNNIQAIGPTKDAGQIEWDKSWSRDFMEKYKIPSPFYKVFNNKEEGFKFLDKKNDQAWFIKASGLAEGKGVIPANNNQEAKEAIKKMANFGNSGETYLLEDWLIGEEFSAFAVVDGKNFQILGYAQDHKRVNDSDQGPNTGGMGCVSNPLIVSKDIESQVEVIFKKTINGLAKEKRPYKGILYLGGMVVGKKVFIIEFNARWGDPEAQVIIPSIKTDFIKINRAILKGRINKLKLIIDKKVRVVVAGTSKGYPSSYEEVKGKQIFGLEKMSNSKEVKLYGAGIKVKDNKFFANGGRVFYLMAQGKDIIEARKKVYKNLALIDIDGNNLHFRTDIGWRDLARLNK
ncbi:MAG: phosphoribosylamine--glycine ligase [Candidatus Shapirobacteria bacterium]